MLGAAGATRSEAGASDPTVPERPRSRPPSPAPRPRPSDERRAKTIEARDLNLFYGDFHAVENVTMTIEPNKVTALIGSSGCGKTTFLRSLNRMHELTPGARVEGEITLDGEDIYGHGRRPGRRSAAWSAWSSRRRTRSRRCRSTRTSPPASTSTRGRMKKSEKDEVVERSLRGAHLWDEVKDRLDKPGSGLSGGQQQRLCIARAIAVEPEVLLMDEPCSALDPVATLAIEDLIAELKSSYTIVIVTHNMQQAARASDITAFFNLEETGKPGPPGRDRRDRDDLHQPDREGDRGLRQRAIRLMPEATGRIPGGTRAARGERPRRPRPGQRRARAHPGGGRAPGRRAGPAGRRRRRPHRRPLPGGPPGADHAARDAVAGGDRPAPDLGPPARAEERRADGRPVREHLQADPADRQRAAGRRGDGEADPDDGQAGPHADRPVQARLRRTRRRDGARPGPPGRRRRQPQPRVLPAGARDRRRRRPARVGDDDAARGAGDRADRRQRRRHRRAGRLRRHRALPRVRGRLASRGETVQAPDASFRTPECATRASEIRDVWEHGRSPRCSAPP